MTHHWKKLIQKRNHYTEKKLKLYFQVLQLGLCIFPFSENSLKNLKIIDYFVSKYFQK